MKHSSPAFSKEQKRKKAMMILILMINIELELRFQLNRSNTHGGMMQKGEIGITIDNQSPS